VKILKQKINELMNHQRSLRFQFRK